MTEASQRLTAEKITEFRRKISGVADMHLEFERQFEEFNRIIPYKSNSDTIEQIYSPRLYSLLQGIKSNIDAMCCILGGIFQTDTGRKEPTAFDYFEILNAGKMLDAQILSLIENPILIKPFERAGTDTVPGWWVADNKTKHELPEGASRATYGNVIKSLAALVSMLHIADNALSRWGVREMLNSGNWRDNSERFLSIYSQLEFTSFSTPEIDWARREYMGSPQKKYFSAHFYYLSDYLPPSLT